MTPDRGFMLCLLVCSVMLQYCMSLPVAIQQGPVPRHGRRAQFRVLSRSSGFYVSVIRSGRLHAHAARPNRNTRFFVAHDKPGTISFESVKFRGRFLVMDVKKNKLRLDYPNDGNENFKIVPVSSQPYSALETFNGCYVAFDVDGKPLDPCTQSIHDREAQLYIQTYTKY